MFNTQFDFTDYHFYSRSGDPIVSEYKPYYNERGSVDLEKCGEYNIYDQIQSFADSVDVHVLLKRFKNGDINAFDRVRGFYADVTDMPKTVAELYQRVSDLNISFEKLPAELKSKFDNNPVNFFMNVGSASFNEVMKQFYPKESKIISVKEDPINEK